MFAVLFCNITFADQQDQTQKYIQVNVKFRDGKYQPRDTRTIDLLEGFTPAPEKIEYSKFGGWKNAPQKFDGKGFFYPKKIGDRWWFIDPDGYPFIHVAMAGTYRGYTPLASENSKKYLGDGPTWAEFTTSLLDENCFNGVGGWSEGPLLRESKHPKAYTNSWDFLADFAKHLDLAHQNPGQTGYPSEVPPIFHPGFEKWCDEYAKEKVITTKDDPWLIGHFSDNELPLWRVMLDNTLKLDIEKYPDLKYNYAEAKRFLVRRKGKTADVNDITEEDRIAFLEKVLERYFSLTTAAIRKYDPNHLCLGSRFNGRVTTTTEVFQIAGKYLDVISVNYYHAWSADPDRVNMWVTNANKPVLITEYYAKGMDSGMKNISGAGWTVETQKERGLFYQNFMLSLLETKNIVGWHWFKYRDNEPDDPSVIAGNVSSNKGIVTWDYKPYTDLLVEMKKLNENVYLLTDYFDSK